MKRPGETRMLAVALLSAVTMLAACGGGGDDDPDDGEPTGVTGEPTATTAAGEQRQAAPTNQCPLSAAQVSEALGVTVEQDQSGSSSCSFFPPGGASPRAFFVRLSAIACTEEYFQATGLDYESYDGLDVEAYATLDAAPASIIVCANTPFDINVEIPGDPAASLAAASELAQIVLESD